MAEHPLDEVARQFSRFSASDRLAKLGGLQLIPENSRRALRLELAACAAASTAEGGEFTATAEEIRTILNRSAVSDPQLVMLEDPTGGWFVESVTFVGGAYLVFPGITTDATFTLDLLGRALALYRRPYSSGGFAPSAVRLLQAALLVSDEVAKRAGLGRGVLATGAAESSDIVVPEDSRLAALAEAVRFTGAELNDILRPCEADSSILDPLMIECGQLDLSSCDTQTYALQSTPIVQVDSEYIVAAPSLLTPAARHQVVCMAKKHQVVDELAARVNLAAWNTAVKCFRYMRITLSAPRFPGPRPSLLMADGLFGFDTDKALYAAVISDDLTDYDEETVFGAAPEQRVWPALKAHLDRVFWSLAKSDNPPNAVLCVVLSSGLGRAWGFGVGDRGASPPYKLMAMTVSDLTVIAHLEGGHSLFLWKFCSAGDRLRERCEVFAAGSLSEYGCYRDRDYSFYLSDREIPNMLTLASDWDGPLRTEYLDKVDPHGVPSHDGRHISGVVALHGTRSVPIYTEEATLGERVALLVEGYAIPIWVVGPESYEAGDAATHPALVQLADMIAYWLWQYEPSMRDWFAKTFARTRQVLVISIDADESLEVRTSDLDSLASGEPFHIQTPEGSAAVQVTFHAAVAGLLDGPENHRS